MTPADLVKVARRVMMTIGRGKITGVTDSGVVQMLQVSRGPAAMQVRDNTPMVGLFGLASNPPLQSDVIILSVGGDFNNAVALATNHQTYRPKNTPQGDTILYDIRTGQTVHLSAAGVTVTDAWGNTIVSGQAGMTLTHSAKVTVNAPAIALAGSGGEAVARVGDSVNLSTGLIESGSTKVTSN